jgi:hypothetical protein
MSNDLKARTENTSKNAGGHACMRTFHNRQSHVIRAKLVLSPAHRLSHCQLSSSTGLLGRHSEECF